MIRSCITELNSCCSLGSAVVIWWLAACAGLHHNVQMLSCDLFNEGNDSYADFALNGGPEYVAQLADLQRNGIPDPLSDNKTTRVEILHADDGAARNSLSGNSSHSVTAGRTVRCATRRARGRWRPPNS